MSLADVTDFPFDGENMTEQTSSPEMGALIVDLDNCLADDGWRIRMIDWSKSVEEGRYDEYHDACPGDDINADLKREILAHPGVVAFFTARPESVREKTVAWLEVYEVWRPGQQLLFMRREHDHRPSDLVKLDMLNELLNPNNAYGVDHVTLAYDDHPEVIAMYAREDIACCHRAIHDLDAYLPPAAPQQLPPPVVPQPTAWPWVEGLGKPGPEPRPRAPENLEQGAVTFRGRNAIYGDNYLAFGAMMAAMFPDGLSIAEGDTDSFNRLGIFVQCLAKVSRYAVSLTSGGHEDSAHDLMVYGAMLEEVTARKGG
jgi:hypothetical protein